MTAGGPPSPRRSWIVALFTERLLTKVLALAMALLIWAVVRGEETTDVTLTVPLLTVVADELEVVGALPDSVQVVVTGRLRELLKLRASPPVVRRRFDVESPRRQRVVLEPVDVEFPVGVVATAREVRPASFLLTVRMRTTAGTR